MSAPNDPPYLDEGCMGDILYLGIVFIIMMLLSNCLTRGIIPGAD